MTVADPEIPEAASLLRRQCSLEGEHDAHEWTSDDGVWWCKTRTWLGPGDQCSYCGTAPADLPIDVDPDDAFEMRDGALFCKPCADGRTQALDRADDEADEAWQRHKDGFDD